MASYLLCIGLPIGPLTIDQRADTLGTTHRVSVWMDSRLGVTGAHQWYTRQDLGRLPPPSPYTTRLTAPFLHPPILYRPPTIPPTRMGPSARGGFQQFPRF